MRPTGSPPGDPPTHPSAGPLPVRSRARPHHRDGWSGGPRPACSGRRAGGAPSAGRRPPVAAAALRPVVSQPRRARGRIRQAGARGAGVGEPGLRVRRDRHDHRPTPARQPQAADLPAARGSGGHQPARLQQRRGGGCGESSGRVGEVRAGSPHPPGRQHRQDEGCGGRRCRLRLDVRACRPVRRLRRRQHQLAQHARPARPAGARRP